MDRPTVGEEPITGSGYRLVEFLGAGGFGEVWKASGPGGTHVALKIVDLADYKGVREFRALSQIKNIKHPNLITIFGIWLKDRAGRVFSSGDTESPDSGWLKLHGGQLVIAMDLGEESLATRLYRYQEKGALIPIGDLLDYMTDAARGIDYLNQPNPDLGAHHSPLQHCDIKPGNLLIVGGCIKICDFGLARTADVHARASSAGFASLVYCPPEYLVHATASKASDQYSLAVTYHELRTGHLPFKEGQGAVELMTSIAEGKLDFSRIASPREREVVQRAASRDPKKRYGSVREMVTELRRAIETPVVPRAPGASDEFFVCPPRAQAGDEIVPHYQLVSRLGAGGFGEVWQANGPGDIAVAIKIIAELDGLAGRELEALELIKNVRHLHLLALQGYWLIDANGRIISKVDRHRPDAPKAKRLIIASELADKSLRQRLNECRQQTGGKSGIEPKELLRYMRQTAEAIDYLNTPCHRAAAGTGQWSSVINQPLTAAAGAKVKDMETKPPTSASVSPNAVSPSDEDGSAANTTDSTVSVPTDWGEALPLHKVEPPAPATATGNGARGQSIQHRDIKPDNILLVGPNVKVADFSLVKLLEGRQSVLHQRSSALTLAYAAPELFHGIVTRWSDQYSLAITYCHLRTGRLPFTADSPEQVMKTHRDGSLDLSGLSPGERDVIKRATSPTPESRYPTCVAMVDALDRAIFGSRGDRRLWPWLIMIVVVVSAAAGISLWLRPSIEPMRRDVGPKTTLPTPTPTPKVAVPSGTEPSAGAAIVKFGDQRWWDRIVRKKNDTAVTFRLVPETATSQLRAYYIMEGKVTNRLFEAAGQASEFRSRLAEVRRQRPWAIQEQWNQGTGSKELNWADKPVQRVTVTEAMVFAEWLGGKLPTAMQWDKARELLPDAMGDDGREWTRTLTEGTGGPIEVDTIDAKDWIRLRPAQPPRRAAANETGGIGFRVVLEW
jgi:serine/threonine protein kinase